MSDQERMQLQERPVKGQPPSKAKAKPKVSSNLKPNGYTDKKTGGFGKGNKGGPGNPLNAKTYEYKMAFFATVGPDKFARAIRATYNQLFGIDRESGEMVHADVTDRLTWVKLHMDRFMGKVPNTLVLEEGAPPTDEDDAESRIYD